MGLGFLWVEELLDFFLPAICAATWSHLTDRQTPTLQSNWRCTLLTFAVERHLKFWSRVYSQHTVLRLNLSLGYFPIWNRAMNRNSFVKLLFEFFSRLIHYNYFWIFSEETLFLDMGDLKPSKEILVHLGEWVSGQFQFICSLACEQCLWLEPVTIFLSDQSENHPTQRDSEWLPMCLAFPILCSVAEWPCGSFLLLERPCGTFTTPLFLHKRLPVGIISCYFCGWNGVAQWHFATPLFSQESAKWLTLVTFWLLFLTLTLLNELNPKEHFIQNCNVLFEILPEPPVGEKTRR